MPRPSIDVPPKPDLKPLCGRFEATDGSSKHFDVHYQSDAFTLGRDLECSQALIGNGIISRLHCALRSVLSEDAHAFSIFVKDHSKNGTFVNGIRLQGNQYTLVEDGTILALGGVDGPAFKFIKYEPRSLQAQYCMTEIHLGQGTFGTVTVAHNRRTGAPVAVKAVNMQNLDDLPEERARRRTLIRREIRIMGRVRHPNIIQLENAFVDGDTVYIAMELAPEGSLSELIHKSRGLSEWDSKVITRQICTALAFLHRLNIIHRDVKPGNILIHSYSPPVVKISDFGLAKAHDARAPDHTVCGTPYYMAPEICCASNPIHGNATGQYGTKVDSWAVGVTVFTMLAGRVPFKRPDEHESLEEFIRRRKLMWEWFPATGSFICRDFITRLCATDPNSRASMETALDHSWLKLAG